jgi:ribosomal protein L34E
MKRDELMKHAKCTHCGKGVGHTGLPLFWKVTMERFGVDMRAAQRQDGLGVAMGSHALAAVMGPDEDLAKPMQDKPHVATLCETCVMHPIMVAALAEIAREAEPQLEPGRTPAEQ